MSRKLEPASPGEMLAVKPLGMSNDRLPKEIGVPAQRIGEILVGKRAITADTDLRLCRSWRLRMVGGTFTGRLRYRDCKGGLAKELAKIGPWKEAAKHTADAHGFDCLRRAVAAWTSVAGSRFAVYPLRLI